MTIVSKKAPRYESYQPTSPAASQAKRHNRPTNTRAEQLLRHDLWARGLRYRLHAKDLPGKPDIVFRRHRVAVFVDGDFWHGRNWTERAKKLANGSNATYWVAKIAYNIELDARNNRLLASMGWSVLRFWETDVVAAPSKAGNDVAARISLLGS